MPIGVPGERRFALKVGFAQWYDPHVVFCRQLNDYKRFYRQYGLQSAELIKRKLEFTKFECDDAGNGAESCAQLAFVEDRLRHGEC